MFIYNTFYICVRTYEQTGPRDTAQHFRIASYNITALYIMHNYIYKSIVKGYHKN